MALVKCTECGKEISSNASKCIYCGCPSMRPKKANTKIIISGVIVVAILLLFLVIIKINTKNTLKCTFKKTNDVGIFDYKITYTFKNGSINSLQGYQYTKPSNSEVAEYLWKVSNNQQDQYNYYDGLSYKATFSEDKGIVLNYSIDVNKAPKMFNAISTLGGVNGITSESTIDEIKTIYEENGYVCK